MSWNATVEDILSVPDVSLTRYNSLVLLACVAVVSYMYEIDINAPGLDRNLEAPHLEITIFF